MAKTYRFYLVDESEMVTGTDDLEIALIAKRSGAYLVIEPKAAEATIDGDTETIEPVDPDEFADEVDAPTDDEDTDK